MSYMILSGVPFVDLRQVITTNSAE